MIVTRRPPYLPFMDARMAKPPGVMPLDPAEWFALHEDFPAQMAYREELIASRPEVVLGQLPEGGPAAGELLAVILRALHDDPRWTVEAERITRPDGVTVDLDRSKPMATAGRLVAEDLCLMAPDAASGEYRLVAAVLCFPSRWLLSEKLGRPMTAIHDPVPDYDEDLARRVNRMFMALRPERPLWRVNWVVNAVPELHLPLHHSDRLVEETGIDGPYYLRTERQTLVRLPETGAVVFGIKTTVTPFSALAPAEARALEIAVAGLSEGMVRYKGGAEKMARARAELREIAGQEAALSASCATN